MTDWRTISHRQQYLHDHIARCTGCGAWEIVTDIELRMRAADQWPAAAVSPHRGGEHQPEA